MNSTPNLEASVQIETITDEDHYRFTDRWNTGYETFLEDVKRQLMIKEKSHHFSGHHFMFWSRVWGTLDVIVPAIFGPLTLIVSYLFDRELSCEDVSPSVYVSTIGLMVSAIVGGILGFYKYGQRSNEHFVFENRFSDIRTDILIETVRDHKFREQPSLFAYGIQKRMDNCIMAEPTIPLFIEKRFEVEID